MSKRIYDHAFECGWLSPGSLVLDPFGGIGGFALQAMAHGCEWVGVELEQKFVDLGDKNIALWNKRYSRFPRWCSRAVLLQGDSRNLLAVVEAGRVQACVSSPPFAEAQTGGGICNTGTPAMQGHDTQSGTGGYRQDAHGSTPGNLGNLRPGDFSAAISSPPYAESMESGPGGIDWHKAGRDDRTIISEKRHSVISNNAPTSYGHAPGQLGSMRPGDFDAAVSSPPYVSGGHHPDQTGAWGGQAQSIDRDLAGYGREAGQLGQMKEGDFAGAVGADGVISSPPFADRTAGRGTDKLTKSKGLGGDYDERLPYEKRGFLMGQEEYVKYSAMCNLGSFRETTDTFWAAARVIVAQTYAALKPGGHAIFVTKRFCRAGAIVDFSQQWAQLCQSCGFTLVHWHKAMLTEEAEQIRFDGSSKRKKRVSFFRRLHEKKRPDLAIDWEDVLCFAKECDAGERTGGNFDT